MPSIFNTNKIKISLIIIQVCFFILFITSHFLDWAFGWYAYFPQFPRMFIGLDLDSGILSIIYLNSLFILGLFCYLYFFFRKKSKFYLIYWFIINIVIISCVAIFIYAIVGIIQYDISIHLDQLVFGFYLWLVSIIIVIGLLLYINLKFIKRSNFQTTS